MSFSVGPEGHLPELFRRSCITRQPFFTNRTGSAAPLEETPWGRIPIHCFLSVPVIIGDELLGQISLANAAEGVSERHLSAVTRLADYFALGIRGSRREEALRNSEERFRTLVETMNDGLAVVNEVGSVTYVNEKYTQMIGHSREEIVSGGATGFKDPESRALLKKQLAERRQGKSGRYEATLTRADGRKIPVIVSGRPILDRNGQFKGSFGVFTDITELKATEAALRKSEEKYRMVVENSAEAILIIQDSVIKMHNQKAVSFSGFTPEDLSGKSFLEFIHPGDRERVAELHARRTAGEEVPSAYAFRLRTKDGSARWCYAHIVPIMWEQRQAFLAFATDITDLKRTEQELRDSEDRYRQVVENVYEGIIVTQDGKLKFANRRCKDVTGVSQNELTSDSFLKFVHPEDRAKVIKNYRLRMQGDESLFVYSFRVVPRGGKPRWVEIQSVGITWEGRPASLGFMTDITERKRQEEALQRVHEQVKTDLRDKEQMLREIHHRVRNNLQVMSSMIQLQSDGIEDDSAKDILAGLERRVTVMALVHEHCYMSPNVARINASHYIRVVAEHFLLSLGSSGGSVRLDVDVEKDILWQQDTAIPCGLILCEILTNSLKYAFPASRDGTISIRLRSIPGGGFEMLLADDGVGISVDVDFSSPDHLGLKLVRLLAEQLGASIELDRQEGTRYILLVPAADE
ncbi:PAS domain S-box protein [Thermodesulfobacteriota bacterium]